MREDHHASTPAEADDGMQGYARAVQELVLWMRAEGHVLSPMDSHLICGWWEAGYPLEVVLGAVRQAGTRVLRRRNPPRGLPLTSLRRSVDAAGRRALALAVGSTDRGREAGEREGTDRVLAGLLAETSGLLGASCGDGVGAGTGAAVREAALAEARRELESLAGADLRSESVFSALLGVSRRYYEALDSALDPCERDEMSRAILSDLAEAAPAMDPDVLARTVDELRRRTLRLADPVLDPDRYWNLD